MIKVFTFINYRKAKHVMPKTLSRQHCATRKRRENVQKNERRESKEEEKQERGTEIQREWENGRGYEEEEGGSHASVCTGVGISAYIRERVPAQPTADALAERSCPPTSGSQSSLTSIFLPPVRRHTPARARARCPSEHKGNRCARRLYFVSINIRIAGRSSDFFLPRL